MDSSDSVDEYWIGKCLSERSMEDGPLRLPHEAPLLRRFKGSEQDFQFMKLEGAGEQGFVLSACLSGKRYAIKLYYPIQYLEDSRLGPEEQDIYMHPISCDSRAHARLQDLNEDDIFAVKCLGWIKISNFQVDLIRTLFKDRDFVPLGLVKEWVNTDADVSLIPKMINNLDIAEQCGLFIQDVHPSNYGGAKFLDLGAVRVQPYPPAYWPRAFFTESFNDHRNRLRNWTVSGNRFVDNYEN